VRVRVVLFVASLAAVSAVPAAGHASTVQRLPPRAAVSFADGFGGVVPAGDLNRDGHADVLDERTVSHGLSQIASITARDGRTGREIWRWHRPSPDLELQVATGRLGRMARRGVLILSESDQGDQTVVMLRALAGTTGHELWKRRIDSGPDADIELADVTHELPGPDLDVVVALADDGPSDLLEPLVVSGRDGHVHRLPARPGSGEPEVILTAVPDLDGNGLDDLVMARGGAHPGVVAEDGVTGRTIWALRGPGFRNGNALVQVVGRLTGGGVPDLVISTNPPRYVGRQVQTLVRGGDGHILWSKRADQVLSVQRAGPRLLPAVDLVNDFEPSKQHQSGRVGLSVRSYTASGHLIYETMKTLPDPAGLEPGQLNASIAGDFQPDGAKDVQISILAPGGRARSGWINGRTGAFHKVSLLAFPVGHLSPTGGTDLIDTQPQGTKGRRLVLSAVNATHGVYWTRHLTVPSFFLGQVTSLHASTSRCANVLLSGEDFPGNQLAAVYTGSGRLLWSVRFTGTALFGGHVTRHAAPKRLCAGEPAPR
jgi:hypothetical protein